ncbi:MAG: hypothetical protein ACTSR0_06115 [Candidatus Asgardarchaeia archaeon]
MLYLNDPAILYIGGIVIARYKPVMKKKDEKIVVNLSLLHLPDNISTMYKVISNIFSNFILEHVVVAYSDKMGSGTITYKSIIEPDKLIMRYSDRLVEIRFLFISNKKVSSILIKDYGSTMVFEGFLEEEVKYVLKRFIDTLSSYIPIL